MSGHEGQDVEPLSIREERKTLGEYLREAGLLTDVQIRIALYEQRRTGKPLGKILVEHGWVDERTVTSSLMRQARSRLGALLKNTPEKNEKTTP